jgi:uncharacterized protein YecA (UPF0149 family)
MDTRTGEFLTDAQMKRLVAEHPEFAQFIKPVKVEPTPLQLARRPVPRVGRNEPCPCGSGKKFKKCCMTR